jgi:hypothetical protein
MIVGHKMGLNDRYSMVLVLVVRLRKRLECYLVVVVVVDDDTYDLVPDDDVELYPFEEYWKKLFVKPMLYIND